MVFLNPVLLYGLGAVAIPVLLHWMMRAKPKPLLFPALRLIQDRRRRNVQRMRLRHLWLLLLRMALLALLVLALVRPTVPSVNYSLSAADWGRLALVVAAGGVAYYGIVSYWKRGRIAPPVLQHRRSLLRGGLLFCGMLAIAGGVVWPYQRRLSASLSQPTLAAAQDVPVAAVLLFDNSLSMQYQHEGQTRLAAAQKIAMQHVRTLPGRSRVAVGDTASDDPFRFQLDLGGAVARIEALQPQISARPLEDRLISALGLHRDEMERSRQNSTTSPSETDDVLREVYVFTDLAASAWRGENSPRLREHLARLPACHIYLIDVSVTDFQNIALQQITLASESAPLGTDCGVQISVLSTGPAAVERNVEISVANEQGRLIKTDQAVLHLEPGTVVQKRFSVRATAGTALQGEIRLVTADPLPFDDVRYFSVQLAPPQNILIVAESPADAQYVVEALAPSELVRLGKARYACHVISPRRLTTERLERFAAVLLIDVSDPAPHGWQALGKYVRAGGGLGLSLGPQVRHSGYLLPEAQSILPGDLRGALRFNPPETLDITDTHHLLFHKFAELGTGELNSIPIVRYWRVEPSPEGSVIARYTGGEKAAPAWLERTLGRGRVVMFTSALNRRGWNDLPTEAGFFFLPLVEQWVEYLSRAGSSKFNFLAGDPVAFPLSAEKAPTGYVFRKPERQQLPGDIAPGSPLLALPPRDLDQLGNYRILGSDKDSPLDVAFAVNALPAESRPKKIDRDQLDRLLGAERYSISRDIENLQHRVRQGRVGREAVPVVALLLLLAFVAEHLVANFFYETPHSAGAPQ